MSGSLPLRTLIGVGLASAAILIIELSLTRIFSVTMYYHFAFLAISIALFGLSASGVYVFVSGQRLAATGTDTLLARQALAFAVVSVLSLAVLLRLPVVPGYSTDTTGVLLAMYVIAAMPFFAGGAVITVAMSRLSAHANAVYAADLIGAGVGCLLLMPALDGLGGPGAVVLAAVCAAAAAVLFAAPGARRRYAIAATAFVLLVAATAQLPWRPFTIRYAKGHSQDTELFSKWNSFSRIAVYKEPLGDWSLSPTYDGPRPSTHLMDIDASAATQILQYSGDLKSVAYLQYELTTLGHRVVSSRHGEGTRTPYRALVIGPGGGRDVLSGLLFGASRIDGVEINPIIVNDVMRGQFRGYSGGVYDDPRVQIHVEDGRTFVRRSAERFDLIQASLVDTWAATAAGAYTLTENNLYTVEAFDDYLNHLNDDGVLAITRWVFDGLRLVSLAREAMSHRQSTLADRLVIVQNHDVATFLFKRTPFTAVERAAVLSAAHELDFHPLYVPGLATAPLHDDRDNYARLILAADAGPIYDALPYDVTPTTDDRPFYFHTARLRDHPWIAAVRSRVVASSDVSEAASATWKLRGPGALIALLAISAGLVALFIIAPLAVTSRSALTPGWARWLACFGCFGIAFMLIEVALLQRFVLLLGHPVYSLTATLFSLLIGTGLGSAMSRGLSGERVQRTAAIACLAIAGVAIAWATVLPSMIDLAMQWPLSARLAVAVLCMLPAGILMGIPLPASIRLLRRSNDALVPWAWSINGAFSVVGATSAVFIAMYWGFSITLVTGAFCYAIAAWLLGRADAPASPATL